MKNFLLYFLMFVSVSFIACSDDDDSACAGNSGPLAVMVDGASMVNATGTAEINASSIRVNITGSSSNNSTIFFTAPNTVGTYDLSLGQTDSRTVTAFVPAETLNIILTSGCYEIVSISDSQVVMRFNIDEDGDSIKGEIALNVV